MIPIVFIDNSGGMSFNNRRQSRDSILNKRILALSEKSVLLMNSYSYKLFENLKNSIIVNEKFLEVASEGQFCFNESFNLSEFKNKIEKIIVYKWNRDYPADFYLDINLNELKLESVFEFEGSSHEKITEEIYINEKK